MAHRPCLWLYVLMTACGHNLLHVQAALRAALQGLKLCGKDEREPPEGSMTLALMRHQRLALDWMLRREAGSAAPVGGILADDQVQTVYMTAIVHEFVGFFVIDCLLKSLRIERQIGTDFNI